MNCSSSLRTADAPMHLRIVAMALIAGIIVVTIGIKAHGGGEKIKLSQSQIEAPQQVKPVPVIKKPTISRMELA